MPPDEIYAFGPFRLDCAQFELSRAGERIPLAPKSFELLAVLVRQAGRVLTRDELIAAVWPDLFVSDANLTQSVSLLRKALSGDRDDGGFIETVPRRGYRFVAPVNRLQDDGTRSAAIVPAAITPAAIAPTTTPQQRRTWVWAVAALATLTAIALAVAVFHPRQPVAKTGAIAPPVRPAVAVLGLKNLTGDPQQGWLATAIGEVLLTELGADGRIRQVPAESVGRARAALALPVGETLAPDTLARVQRQLAVDALVAGTYALTGDGLLRLDLRLQDAASGQVLATLGETGSEAQMFELASRAGRRLRSALAPLAGPPLAGTAVPVALPGNPRAARLYAEALARWRTSDRLAARDLLLQAVEVDPSSPLTHSLLAGVWLGFGDKAQAQREATRAFELAGDLPPNQRLAIEGRLRRAAGDWQRATAIYRTLLDRFPDSLEYGIQLATSQAYGGKPHDALATVARLRRLPSPLGDAPALDLVEAQVAQATGDATRQLAAARRAAAGASERQATIELAQARLAEGWALASLGRPTESIPVYEEARRLAHRVADLQIEGLAFNRLATTHQMLAQPSPARRSYEEALALFRRLGDDQNAAAALANLASLAADEGRLPEATQLQHEAWELWRDAGSAPGECEASVFLAGFEVQLGELAQADTLLGEAAKRCAAVGAQDLVAWSAFYRAELTRQRGELAAAAAGFADSAKTGSSLGDPSLEAWAAWGEGEVLLSRGDLVAAQKRQQQAVDRFRSIAEGRSLPYGLASLSAVSLARGEPAAAEVAARDAAERFAALQARDGEAQARLLLARVLWRQQRFPQAAAELDQARALAATSESPRTRILVDLAAARSLATSGDLASARPLQDRALREARRRGFRELVLQAELAGLELEAASPAPRPGLPAAAAALAGRAERAGFRPLAAQAAQLIEAGKARPLAM